MAKEVTELSAKNKTEVAPERKKSRLIIIGAVVVLGLGAVFYGHHWYTTGRFMEDTDDAYVGGDVTVISPKVAGNITEIVVGDNQLVHAGDVLVRIDNRDYLVALSRAKAAVASEEAELANMDAIRYLQESVIDQAKAGISATDAETNRARDDQSRYQNLSSKAAVSVQSFQKADADYKQALAGSQKAHANLNAAQRQIDVIATQKQKIQAALAQAVALRDLAELNVSYTELRAPIDGVIGNRRARLGAYATVGGQLLAIVPAQGLWVDANFKENQLAHIHPGSVVTITADVLPDEIFRGHVASLAPATGAQFSILPAENATGNFTKIVQRVPVRVILEGEGGKLGKLRPGLSVNAQVDDRPASRAKS
ncbi:HlyD family secretion protein [Glaciimonas sp. PAMC28666]|uniref:HlyD family secretion protein n=1 Tax=Glaciimonas sp. PAMC28666 TaxID=2807626 RepID=UPI001962E19F|nr:HlyD family secretion protein [Glaciimonas sp. PAMC28666]QRX82055.1 HlyD family secretion protein [Glaciimonas sp. PAMC28666]